MWFETSDELVEAAARLCVATGQALPKLMNTTPASLRAWAQRLLAVEAENQSASKMRGHEVVRVCEKLRISLAQFVGEDGFTALLRRAVALARADAPSLQTVKVTADGRLEGIEEFAAGAQQDVEAATAITAQVLSLLVTFIGESITLRLLRDAWPETSGRRIVESEDFDEQRTN
jgi:hypothetical protein